MAADRRLKSFWAHQIVNVNSAEKSDRHESGQPMGRGCKIRELFNLRYDDKWLSVHEKPFVKKLTVLWVGSSVGRAVR